jgi:hypothetical protein
MVEIEERLQIQGSDGVTEWPCGPLPICEESKINSTRQFLPGELLIDGDKIIRSHDG